MTTALVKRPKAPRATIIVTSSIIRGSKTKSSSHCMIAEAVKATYPTARSIAVDIQTIRWTDKERGLRYTYLTPRQAQIAIIDFDDGKLPQPFQFALRGAQISRMFRRSPAATTAARARDLFEPKKPAAAKKGKTNRGKASARLRSDVVVPERRQVSNSHKDGTVPDTVGGRPPPVSQLSHRREFGLRGLHR